MIFPKSFMLPAFRESDGLLTSDSGIITSLMTQFNFTQEAPLFQDAEGRIRVKNSRVTLDTLVARFQVGDTIEEINEGFPTVSIAQIYAVIAWYLNNQPEADEYLDRRNAEAEETRRTIESQPGYAALRSRLIKYREQLKQS